MVVYNRRVLQNHSIDDLTPHDCYCHISPFKYNANDHVIIGDLDIIDNKNHYSFKQQKIDKKKGSWYPVNMT